MLAPASILLIAILIIPVYEQNFTMIFSTTGAMVAGFILYPLMSLAKERGWMRFADLEFDFAHFTSGNARTYMIFATGELNYDPTYNAEYVDVVHDGDTGVRATGSSMDLGSSSFAGSSRGPGSVAGSLGGFGTLGGSPRSPIGPYWHLLSNRAVGRMGSAPAAVAAVAAPAGAAAAVAAEPDADVSAATVPATRAANGPAATAADDAAADAVVSINGTAAAAAGAVLSPAVAAMAAMTSGGREARQKAAARVSSFRVRLSSEGMAEEAEGPDEPAGDGGSRVEGGAHARPLLD